MDDRTRNAWTLLVSDLSAPFVDRLQIWVNLSHPPSFEAFAEQQWTSRLEGNTAGWSMLMETQLLLRAIAHPTVLSRPAAQLFAGRVMEEDPLFDTKLLRQLLADRRWPDELPPAEVMRTLEVLEAVAAPQRLTMTLLKFAKFPDCRIRSKAAKILGRCIESPDVMDELFDSPDARVRSNLLEGIGRSDSMDSFRPLIERATRDHHPRVSSFALALMTRLGHNGARALITMRSKSKMEPIRQSAEAARRIAAEQLAAGGDAFRGEPAVFPAIAEVAEQSERHPDEQPEPVLSP